MKIESDKAIKGNKQSASATHPQIIYGLWCCVHLWCSRPSRECTTAHVASFFFFGTDDFFSRLSLMVVWIYVLQVGIKMSIAVRINWITHYYSVLVIDTNHIFFTFAHSETKKRYIHSKCRKHGHIYKIMMWIFTFSSCSFCIK